jgi:RNA-binding protein Musashi
VCVYCSPHQSAPTHFHTLLQLLARDGEGGDHEKEIVTDETMSDYYGNSSTNNNTNNNSSSNNNTSNNTKAKSDDHGKIFVGGLSWQTTEESLRWHFEQYGPVLSVELMKDRNTGRPRGFGFVCFTEAETVDLVMDESRHEINHKIVDVKRAQARGLAPPSIHQGHEKPEKEDTNTKSPGNGNGPPPSSNASVDNSNNKVFVGGIPPQIDRDGLRTIMEQFAPVQDCVVMLDQATMRSRGFGFVTFEVGTNGADKAIEAQPLNISGRNVEVKLATPRAEQGKRAPPTGAPKHLGLRAGQSSSSSGEFAGLAVAYGRNGWKAGYGSYAFGPAGWAVQGWEGGPPPQRSGFSFDMIMKKNANGEPPSKRARHDVKIESRVKREPKMEQ